MNVKDVLLKYHAIVPFPWTIAKIEKAGHKPSGLIVELGSDLLLCEDNKGKTCQKVIAMVNQLKAVLIDQA